jgi:hypothetical protein
MLRTTPRSALTRALTLAPQLPFALEYPRVRNSNSGAAPDALRLYAIRDPGGRVRPAYAIVIDRGQLGEFYDVQGTTWPDPPLLRDPTQTIRAGPRSYGLFYEGERLRAVAWREGGAVYWIENTLIDSVPPREMLAMAERTLPVTNQTATASPGSPIPTGFTFPQRAGAASSATSRLGAVLGFIGLLAVAVLGSRILSRQRELNRLADLVANALAAEASQRRALAAVVASSEPASPVPRERDA